MDLSGSERKRLIEAARKARLKAYAPYSKYRVGAAALTEGGRIFTGCNVENASYGLSLCAERTALVKAASEGCRRLIAIAVAADGPEAASPCGACRQFIAEFGPDALVLCAGAKAAGRSWRLSELLPASFTRSHLRRSARAQG